MRTRKRAEPGIRSGLAEGRRRFDETRRHRRHGAPFPDDLWSLAAELAREHGLNRTARALGLDYYSLKKHLDAAGAPEARHDFIEIPASRLPSVATCTIEVESPHGARMRIQIYGGTLPDLVAITSTFPRER